MEEKDLDQFKTALSRYLTICQAKRSLNHFVPIEKFLDLLRHLLGLFKKFLSKGR